MSDLKDEESKVALEALRHELQYRREKQWKIFSWTATLLLAAIAGVITLVGKTEFDFSLWPQRVIMAFALLVIGAYACLWIHENIKFEGRSRTALLERLKEHGLTDQVVPDPSCAPSFGYSATIVFLTEGQQHGLGIALNEANLLGFEIDPQLRIAGDESRLCYAPSGSVTSLA